jgi:hypothetical protein
MGKVAAALIDIQPTSSNNSSHNALLPVDRAAAPSTGARAATNLHPSHFQSLQYPVNQVERIA